MRSPEKVVDSPSTRAFESERLEALEVVVSPGRGAPGAVREEVTRWLTGRVARRVLDDVLLVVSELVTNSVDHAGGGPDDVIRVRAQAVNARLHLEVEDGGRSGDVACRPADSERAGGFGLNAVEQLSVRWGVNRDVGTRVWAEFATATAGDA